MPRSRSSRKRYSRKAATGSRKTYQRKSSRRSSSRKSSRRSASRRTRASSRKSSRKSTKVCPPGQIAVRGHRSRSGSYIQPYCRDVSKSTAPRKKADCPADKPLWTRGYYNAYGTYVRPHCTKIGSNRLAGQIAAYQASLAPVAAAAPIVVGSSLAEKCKKRGMEYDENLKTCVRSVGSASAPILLSSAPTSCYRYYQ